ncbi:hypothetical protein GJA_1876 [Janthinobacterium agaricidamnosum NBRC 102515 = DSM 9628]|uniref:Uncharacterized protein n=1 Tax=Janthinobacterium agaricidamnosum NBRC 102515 = DSM 9628 TaxID=1349767 RepID=W0V5I4_9BURK|nr:hypothetical protein GJA_1876 [Janthinobacterium agaricidamnosum NBRC 102515 = DSM 9628]
MQHVPQIGRIQRQRHIGAIWGAAAVYQSSMPDSHDESVFGHIKLASGRSRVDFGVLSL